MDISTHSLTKRLTSGSRQHYAGSVYFNSQPHEEADKYDTSTSPTGVNFNSQPHEEADVEADENLFSDGTISTHSLTKRLTEKSAEMP